MIRDNRNSKEWPESIVTKSSSIPNTLDETEPYAQRLDLSCGHYCINTFGYEFGKIAEGSKLRCRTCGVKE